MFKKRLKIKNQVVKKYLKDFIPEKEIDEYLFQIQELSDKYFELKKKKTKVIMLYLGYRLGHSIPHLMMTEKINFMVDCFISAKAPKDYWDFIIK